MLHRHLVRLRHFVRNPLTQLVVGLILVGSGIAEVVYDLANTDKTWQIGVHHGVIVFGLLQVLQNIPPMVDGIERWIEAIETKDSNPPAAGE